MSVDEFNNEENCDKHGKYIISNYNTYLGCPFCHKETKKHIDKLYKELVPFREKLVKYNLGVLVLSEEELKIINNKLAEYKNVSDKYAENKFKATEKILEEDKKKQEQYKVESDLEEIRCKNLPQIGQQYTKEGDLIKDPGAWLEIIKYTNEELVIKVIKLVNEYYKRYLEIDKIYNLKEHIHNRRYNFELWEFQPEQMNRSQSQLLLYFWPEGASMDLDS
jgi:hypothetical protein